MADDLGEARRRRQQRRTTKPAGAFGPSRRKQATINQVLAKVDAAAEKHDPAAYWAGKTPTPERITAALDTREMYGPEVDMALGGEEPMVDEWESGVRVPSLAQVQALAELTGFPLKFFSPAAATSDQRGMGVRLRWVHPAWGREDQWCPSCGHRT